MKAGSTRPASLGCYTVQDQCRLLLTPGSLAALASVNYGRVCDVRDMGGRPGGRSDACRGQGGAEQVRPAHPCTHQALRMPCSACAPPVDARLCCVYRKTNQERLNRSQRSGGSGVLPATAAAAQLPPIVLPALCAGMALCTLCTWATTPTPTSHWRECRAWAWAWTVLAFFYRSGSTGEPHLVRSARPHYPNAPANPCNVLPFLFCPAATPR